MDIIVSLLIGFLSSILAGIVSGLVAYLFRNKILDTLRRKYYELLGIGIDATYPDLKALEPELAKLFQISSQICVLSFRGSLGCDFLFKNMRAIRNKKIEVLLADPFSEEGISWIEEREREIIDAGYTDSQERAALAPYIDTVKNSINDLVRLQSKFPSLRIYRYSSKAIWAMYIFDHKVAFIGGYTKENFGKTSAYYKVSGKSLLLEIGIRHYEYLRDYQSTLHEPNNS